MKILHPILCYYPSQAGGPANAIYWLNKSLDPSLFSCKIITTQFGIVNAINSKEYSKNHKASFLKGKGKSYVKQSIQELKTSNIVQFSSLFFPPTLPILFSAILKNKTIIISPRGELYEAAINQKKFRKKLWINVIKLIQSKINFHATNDFELEIIRKTFPKAKSTVTIPNYIEMPKKKELDIKMSFVFVGRINPIKNIHLLISAIANVLKKYPRIQLNIVGSARLPYELVYQKSLEELIQTLNIASSVNFLGHLDGEKKNKTIGSSFGLILPSKSENFGNVVLEALAQGTPVIASKNTPWALLEDYNSGFWTESNVSELTKSLLSLLNMKDSDYLQMRQNAYALCKDKFDVTSNIQVWEEYYKKISINT